MAKQPVYFILPDEYADWEFAFLAAALQGGTQGKASPYEVRTLSVWPRVRSIGGLTTLPDAELGALPDDAAGLVLIGGNTWRTPEAAKALPAVCSAFGADLPIGAICDATVFLGMQGLLNGRAHTSNTLEELSRVAGAQYTGQDRYVRAQAVRDGHLVTANGTAYLEFMREMLIVLEAFSMEEIDAHVRFFREGFIAMMGGGD